MIVGWTTIAELELDEVWTFIATDSPDAADRTIERIRHSASLLADYPSLGRRGRLSGTRELIVPNLPTS
jgi:toxin ParE1/3/4